MECCFPRAEALTLLEQLLREQPEYQDARVNLNRLQFREQPAATWIAWAPGDPLSLALAEEEVVQAGAVKPPKLTPADSALIESLPQPEERAMAAEQLQLAAQAVSEGNANLTLQLCGQALLGLGANPGVFANASDAYIRSERFCEAEICLLHAVCIGGQPSIT